MLTDLLQLATTDQNSAAFDAGRAIGMVLSVVLMLGIPALFIFCLIKLVYTKKKGWLYGVIATGLPLLGFFGLIAFGAYQGITGAFTTATTTVIAPDRKVEVSNSDITVVLPGHWADLDNLNEEADLGAGNLAQEEYFLIMAEAKVDFEGDLLEYSELTSGGMVDALEGGTITEPENITINGLPAIQREISGSIDKSNICYLHTAIESKGHYYQVLGWTLKSRKKAVFPVLENVTKSIAEK